jgi:hypothetical protein|tara:strand:+ start:171 stop:392 length:222 start_codon:yes stop_codon:yes gene_type:complete
VLVLLALLLLDIAFAPEMQEHLEVVVLPVLLVAEEEGEQEHPQPRCPALVVYQAQEELAALFLVVREVAQDRE